jgi:hypothetical protein
MNENDIALLRDEAAPSKIAHQCFVDGCAVKVEVVYVLRQRELGNGHLIFDGTRMLFGDLPGAGRRRFAAARAAV